MAIVLIIVDIFSAAPQWHNQSAYELILGQTLRIIVASLLGYFAGEFTNSFVLAKINIVTHGKWLWSRTISSTIAGELIDTIFFISLGFWELLPMQILFELIISNYLLKTLIEIVLTPVTYVIINWLKSIEHEDYFDNKTNFNPFRIAN